MCRAFLATLRQRRANVSAVVQWICAVRLSTVRGACAQDEAARLNAIKNILILSSASAKPRRASKDAERRCGVDWTGVATVAAAVSTLKRDVLVWAGIGEGRDQAEPGLADLRSDAVDEGELPDR